MRSSFFYRAVFDCSKKVDLGRDVPALVLNARLPKDRQLALYTANVYMGTPNGQQVRGFEQAAQSYAGRPVREITEQEFIRLVAMVKGPNMYHPVKQPAQLEQRSARIAALVTGKCQPAGRLDTALQHCDPKRTDWPAATLE